MHKNLAGFALALVLLGLLTACGGGAGGVSGGTASPPPVNSQGVPGYSLTVKTESAVTAGQSCTLRIHLVPDAGSEPPASISGWAGNEYGPPAAPALATAVAGVPGDYQLTVDVPVQLDAGTLVWIRLTKADDSTCEADRPLLALPRL
jgi:hypothetical protein